MITYPLSDRIQKKLLPGNQKAFSVKSAGYKRNHTGITSHVPDMNVAETNTEYLFTLAAPGLRRENILISICGNTMILSAKKEIPAAKVTPVNTEYDYSQWTKMFVLPKDADCLLTQAEYQYGELNIHVPKGNRSVQKKPSVIYVY